MPSTHADTGPGDEARGDSNVLLDLAISSWASAPADVRKFIAWLQHALEAVVVHFTRRDGRPHYLVRWRPTVSPVDRAWAVALAERLAAARPEGPTVSLRASEPIRPSFAGAAVRALWLAREDEGATAAAQREHSDALETLARHGVVMRRPTVPVSYRLRRLSELTSAANGDGQARARKRAR